MMLPPEGVEAMKTRRRGARILREASPGMIERHTMRTAIPVVAALFSGILLATCARAPFRNWGHHLTRAAFVNVNVIHPGTNEVLPGRTVYIEDGIIRRVGPAHDVKTPADTYIIDASGKYLLPGTEPVDEPMANGLRHADASRGIPLTGKLRLEKRARMWTGPA